MIPWHFDCDAQPATVWASVPPAVVRPALSLVEDISGRTFRIVRNKKGSDIKILWSRNLPPRAAGNAVYFLYKGHEYRDARVRIRPSVRRWPRVNRSALVAHELGHVFGLSHTSRYALMNHMGPVHGIVGWTPVDEAKWAKVRGVCRG